MAVRHRKSGARARVSARLTVLWALSGVLGACFPIDMRLHEPAQIARQESQATQIRPGETTRENVHRMLGAAWLSSTRWRFDVYRAADVSKQLSILFITIWPAPLGLFDAVEQGYLLVVYDEQGRVAEFVAGRRQEGSFVFATDRIDGSAGSSYTEVLSAGPISLGVEPHFDQARKEMETVPFVLIDPARAQRFLSSLRTRGTCTLVLSCEEVSRSILPLCGEAVVDRTRIDVQPVALPCARPANRCGRDVPDRESSRVPVLVPVVLQPGIHEIQMDSMAATGSGTLEFGCNVGEVKYGKITARSNPSARWKDLGPSRTAIELENELPHDWEALGLMIYRNGRWLVDPAE
jgi:hypothetical protein